MPSSVLLRDVSRLYRRLMGMALARKPMRSELAKTRRRLGQITKNTAEMLEGEDNATVLQDLRMTKMLRCRVRYLTAGAVIGSKEFVNDAFANARERFGPKRKNGARKIPESVNVFKVTCWQSL